MNKIVVPTCVHVPVCCVLLLHLLFSGLVFQGVPIDFWWLFIFPIFRASTFSAFSFSRFYCCKCFFFGFCIYYFFGFPSWFPNDEWFFNRLKAFHFPLYFCFFNKVGGGADLHIEVQFLPSRPSPRSCCKHQTHTHTLEH